MDNEIQNLKFVPPRILYKKKFVGIKLFHGLKKSYIPCIVDSYFRTY